MTYLLYTSLLGIGTMECELKDYTITGDFFVEKEKKNNGKTQPWVIAFAEMR